MRQIGVCTHLWPFFCPHVRMFMRRDRATHTFWPFHSMRMHICRWFLSKGAHVYSCPCSTLTSCNVLKATPIWSSEHLSVHKNVNKNGKLRDSYRHWGLEKSADASSRHCSDHVCCRCWTDSVLTLSGVYKYTICLLIFFWTRGVLPWICVTKIWLTILQPYRAFPLGMTAWRSTLMAPRFKDLDKLMYEIENMAHNGKTLFRDYRATERSRRSR